jgi:hypothetical protein
MLYLLVVILFLVQHHIIKNVVNQDNIMVDRDTVYH